MTYSGRDSVPFLQQICLIFTTCLFFTTIFIFCAQTEIYTLINTIYEEDFFNYIPFSHRLWRRIYDSTRASKIR